MKRRMRLMAALLAVTVLVLPVSALSVGDTTGDGVVNMMDVMALYKHVSGASPLTENALALADVNGDARVDMMDVMFAYRTCSGLISANYPLDVPTDYTAAEEAATGKTLADYSDGIALPKLSNANVEIMSTVDWKYLSDRNDEKDPFAQYHAVQMWDAVYGAQGDAVTLLKITENAQTEYMTVSTATGEAPDVVKVDYTLAYPRWSAAGLTSSVEEYALNLGFDETVKGQPLYNDEFMDAYFRWGGESHAAVLTREADKQYLVYNRTLFEQAGEKTPLERWQNGTWNWTQFVKTAKTMTQGDCDGFTGWGLFPYFAPYAMIKQDATGKATLNTPDPKYKKYMESVFDFYQHADAAAMGDSLQQWKTMFPMGKAGMVMATKSEFKTMYKSAKLFGYVLGIAPVPAFDPNGETVGIANANVWGYAIPAAAKNPVGAASYIRLEALVTRNIESATDGNTWYDKNLTADELSMLEKTADDPICVDSTRGIGSCYELVDSQIVGPIYYWESDADVSAIFEDYRKALQTEVDALNASL